MESNPHPQFECMPLHCRSALLRIRELIAIVADEDNRIGPISETLKWGQLSYLTEKSKSGSTLRMDAEKNREDVFALLVNCKSTLVDEVRERHGDLFAYEGTRKILVSLLSPLPEVELKDVIHLTLTYHLRKRSKS